MNFSFFFLASTLVFLLSSIYLSRRTHWLFPRLQNKKIYVYFIFTSLGLLQVLAPLWYRLRPFPMERPFWLQWAGYLSLGFMSLLLFYFLFTHLLLTLTKRFSLFLLKKEGPLENSERRIFLGMGFFSATTAAIGTQTALTTPPIETVPITIKDLPPAFNNFKIIQISDLHVGPTIERDYVQRVVERIQVAQPDVIVLTGDMVDGYPDELRYHLEPLKNLTAPYGIYFCTGNHEYYWGGLQWCEEFEKMGFTVLLNQHRMITKDSTQICIGGLTDLKAQRFLPAHKPDAVKTFEGVSSEIIKILLAHHPGSYTHALGAGVHLQLSGHTHGGQFFPWNFIVALTHKFYRGLYFYQNLWIYTNRGTGYWGPPQRFSIPPEITEIYLKQEV